MKIGKYTLPEVAKFLVALAALVIAAVAMFVTLDPNFQPAVETLIYAVLGVVGVFALPHPTQDQVYKALSALAGALLAVIQFYHTIPSSTTTKVIALCFAFAVAYAVWRTPNKTSAT